MPSKFKYWVPAFLWMASIFLFSTDMFAASSTGSVVKAMLHYFFPSLTIDQVHFIHISIRKSAHIGVYALLSYFYRVGFAHNWRVWKIPQVNIWPMFGAIVLTIICACLDEFHQSFSSKRTGTPIDVAWDTLGAALMQTVLWIKASRS